MYFPLLCAYDGQFLHPVTRKDCSSGLLHDTSRQASRTPIKIGKTVKMSSLELRGSWEEKYNDRNKTTSPKFKKDSKDENNAHKFSGP